MIPDLSIAQAEQTRQKHANGGVAHFYVDDAFPGFDGHFPDYPILPGVIQMGMVMDVLGWVLDLDAPAAPAKMEAVKFHSVITPDTSFSITLAKQPRAWHYRIHNETTCFASGRLVLP